MKYAYKTSIYQQENATVITKLPKLDIQTIFRFSPQKMQHSVPNLTKFNKQLFPYC